MSAIRPASVRDLPGVYRVCLQTGASGADASHLYRNPDLLGHIYVGPFMLGAPHLAFVVADRDGVGGYVLAAEDVTRFETWAEAHWWPALRAEYPLAPGDSLDEQAIRLLHEPELAPEEVAQEYPAVLHIDLVSRMQGRGYGRALVSRVLDELRTRRVVGVHLDVGADNANAIAFYRHLGFDDIERRGSSLFMGMRLL